MGDYAPVGRKLENQIASREGKWCGNGGRIGSLIGQVAFIYTSSDIMTSLLS